MVFLTIAEILDMAIMIAFVGFIFKDAFPRQRVDDPIAYYTNASRSDFWFAVMAVAPAIILHEFGHKLIAVAFGLQASFNAAYGWLILGTLLKLMNFGFIFFVPAYVSFGCAGFGCVILPWQNILIAFAGPLVNLLLWGVASVLLYQKGIKEQHRDILFLTKRINMFLFVFNMIPIPGFDGHKVLLGIFQLF
ncbi:MAG TPA: site-2 protease family protein [Candidatus Nanoarchaeia archaeon]|nr:site-2 protease family protein [Candidatus Nanoarchaeia archaeon]